MQYRSLFCSLLAGCTLMTCAPQAVALTDVSHWAVMEVTAAQSADLEPQSLLLKSATGNVTREEFCEIALRLYETLDGSSATPSSKKPFADTDNVNIATAYQLGIVNGRNSTTFDPYGKITRQELCKMLTNIADAAEIKLPRANTELASAYPDAKEVENWAQDSVDSMLSCGIINGVSTRMDDETGEPQTVVILSPKGTTTREQALLVSLRFAEAFTPAQNPAPSVKPDTSSKPENPSSSTDSAAKPAKDPENAAPSVPSQTKGDTTNTNTDKNTDKPSAPDTSEKDNQKDDSKDNTADTAEDSKTPTKSDIPKTDTDKVTEDTDKAPEDTDKTPEDTDDDKNETVKPSIPNLLFPDYLPSTESEKMAYLFGVDSNYYGFYTDESSAKADIVEIEIPVWRLQDDGSKTSGKAYLQIHKMLAPIVQTIFEEIYNGPEQFPIHDVGGWAWRANEKSEHRQGTAIDINFDSNMECYIDSEGNVTSITCGSTWEPDTDPYAIKEGGDVYNAFTKYGFGWGGNAWTSKRDYMHFSFFSR